MSYQQPPYGQGYPPAQGNPGSAPGYHGQQPAGQPPYQYNQQPPPPQQGYGQPQHGQYGQQHPGQQQPAYAGAPPPAQGYYPPPGQAPYQQNYSGPPPQGAPYGQAPYQQQQPPYPPQQAPGYPPQPPPQQYGAPPPGGHPYGAPAQQWQQPGIQYAVPPTPASSGYDQAQKVHVQSVDTKGDIETLRSAMKGMGCDERALIRTLTSPKYANPWAMIQLVKDYNSRFIRDLAKDIESETRGDLETGLLALIRGPLENDVRTLEKALNRAGTDEDALNDVLLCRSNADIRAISAEYKRIFNRDLLAVIKDDVDDTLYRMYSMVLGATKAEDAAPVIAAEIDQKVTEVHHATEGISGSNAIAVAHVFVSSNSAQLHAISEAYQRKYHRSLEDVIEKEFRGDMEDALLRMLLNALHRSRTDADRLARPLTKTVRKDRLFINRVLSMYWDRPRLEATKTAYKAKNGRPLVKDVKEYLSGDYERLMVALIGEK